MGISSSDWCGYKYAVSPFLSSSASSFISSSGNVIVNVDMRTRSGSCYPKPVNSTVSSSEKKRKNSGRTEIIHGKRQRKTDFFDGLPDDLVLSILCKLSSSAESPSDLTNILMTSKRMNGLGLNPMVLSKVSPKSLAIRAKNWSESDHRFLKSCVDAGSVEAAYTLDTIKFYCLEDRAAGAALMAKAAIGSHPAALYSLAIIQFNGSGGCKADKDLRAGVALCARSAYLGHVDALRELGHCLQDGYGVRQNAAEGRRFLLQANARELAATTMGKTTSSQLTWQPPERPANQFLVDWFGSRAVEPGSKVRLCSYGGCGRPKCRKHEFRRCSVCGKVSYCSRACQALHWKLAHKDDCHPVERWDERTDEIAGAEGPVGF